MPLQPKQKTLKFRFYRSLAPDNGHLVIDYMRAVTALPGVARSMPIDGNCLRLQELFVDGGLALGRIVKVRLDAEPAIADAAGEEAPIHLRDDQGLREHSFFLYDSLLRVLALQQNRYVGDYMLMARYLQERAEGRPPLDFVPVVPPDMLALLRQAHAVRYLEARVAVPQRGDFYAGENESMIAASRVLSSLGAGMLHIQLRVGRTRGLSMRLHQVVDFVMAARQMRQINADKVRSLKAVIRRQEGWKDELLDLLGGCHEMTLPVQTVRKQVDVAAVYTQLAGAYADQARSLHEMFGEE